MVRFDIKLSRLPDIKIIKMLSVNVIVKLGGDWRVTAATARPRSNVAVLLSLRLL